MVGSLVAAAEPDGPVDAVVESVDGGELSAAVVRSPVDDSLDEPSLDPIGVPDDDPAIDALPVPTSGGVPKHPVNNNTAILRTCE